MTSGLSCECRDGSLEFADLSSKLFNLRQELWERSSGGRNCWGSTSTILSASSANSSRLVVLLADDNTMGGLQWPLGDSEAMTYPVSHAHITNLV